ncbi:hypothetical protein CENSYa_1363 [Cenarchaeum symbiosum A]|uniref:Permease n=1 Tax=Cenarchaeum symbiosum (strain A) TaxID=414004 RepID=A0RXB9_CENSY|nr:hypothetical protein CENSYa_1363 [Cenarchaeum symbiosum A]
MPVSPRHILIALPIALALSYPIIQPMLVLAFIEGMSYLGRVSLAIIMMIIVVLVGLPVLGLVIYVERRMDAGKKAA